MIMRRKPTVSSSGGEGISAVQGEAIRRRYIKPEYLSYTYHCKVPDFSVEKNRSFATLRLIRKPLENQV